MAIPLSPLKWSQALNPGDEVDYTFDLAGNLLETGEAVASWSLTLSAASIAAGLQTGTGQYASSLTGTVLRFWFSINPSHIADSDFDGTGSWLDMTVEVTTNNSPPRIRNRTLLIHVSRA